VSYRSTRAVKGNPVTPAKMGETNGIDTTLFRLHWKHELVMHSTWFSANRVPYDKDFMDRISDDWQFSESEFVCRNFDEESKVGPKEAG